jgi:hypothetical protein
MALDELLTYSELSIVGGHSVVLTIGAASAPESTGRLVLLLERRTAIPIVGREYSTVVVPSNIWPLSIIYFDGCSRSRCSVLRSFLGNSHNG